MTLETWTRRPGRGSAIRWLLCRPFRAGASLRFLPRGRALFGRLAQSLAWRTVQPGSAILARTPGGSTIAFGADTLIGRTVWTYGAFELGELSAAFRLARPGTYAFDVGANVGLFASVMSRAVGPTGRVIAVEPAEKTVGQLQSNLEQNGCGNVDVVRGAASASAGRISMLLSDDPALHSAGGQVIDGHPVVGTTSVTACTLDELWLTAGRPEVSLVKIDVEGAELAVLLGGQRMINRCRPALIIEVNDPIRLPMIAETLRGYRTVLAEGFEPWNHLLVPD